MKECMGYQTNLSSFLQIHYWFYCKAMTSFKTPSNVLRTVSKTETVADLTRHNSIPFCATPKWHEMPVLRSTFGQCHFCLSSFITCETSISSGKTKQKISHCTLCCLIRKEHYLKITFKARLTLVFKCKFLRKSP